MSKDLEMMKNPAEWPRWPVLPLVKKNSQPWDGDRLAFLFADLKPKIYFGSVFGITEKTWGDYLRKLESKEYSTFEAIAEEYRVD